MISIKGDNMENNNRIDWDRISVDFCYILEFVQNKEVYTQADFLDYYCDLPDVDEKYITFIKRLIRISFIDFLYSNMYQIINQQKLDLLISVFNKEFHNEVTISHSILVKLCSIYNIKVEEETLPIIPKETILDNRKNSQTSTKNSAFNSLIKLFSFIIIITLFLMPNLRLYISGVFNYTFKNYEEAINIFEEIEDYLNAKSLLKNSHINNFNDDFPSTNSSIESAKYLIDKNYLDISTQINVKLMESIELYEDYYDRHTFIYNVCDNLRNEEVCLSIVDYNLDLLIIDEETVKVALEFINNAEKYFSNTLESKNLFQSERDKFFYNWGIYSIQDLKYEEALEKFNLANNYKKAPSYVTFINKELNGQINDSIDESRKFEGYNFKAGEYTYFTSYFVKYKNDSTFDLKVGFYNSENELLYEQFYNDYCGCSIIFLYLPKGYETSDTTLYIYKFSVFEDNKWVEIHRFFY